MHELPSATIIKDTYLSEETPQTDREKDSTVRLFFIWWDKGNRCGVIDPKPITITSTENSPSLVKLPFNAKVLL
jgi:hypothetical protein